MIAVDLAKYLDIDLGFSSVEEIWEEIEKISPIHQDIIHSLSEQSREGVLVKGGFELSRPGETKVQSHDAYSFRLVVTRTMYDQGTFNAYSQSLVGLAPKASLGFEPTDFSALGVEVGEEVEVVGPKGLVVLPAKPDSKVAKGTVHVGLNHTGFSATELIDASVSVTDLTVVSK
jgi:predicted molibdopterin-dependent oxidoreductase YjgC